MFKDKILVKHIFISGFILGVSLSFVEFAAFMSGKIFEPVISNILLFLTIVSLFFSVRKYRNDNPAILKDFANGFKISYLTCIAGGIIWSFFRILLFSFSPNLIEVLLARGEEFIRAGSENEQEIKLALELFKNILSPMSIAFSTFIFNIVFGGAILSLFLGSILRREIRPKNKIDK